MERSLQEQLQERLMASNEQFRRLAEEHAEYARRLDQLASRPYLSEQEQLEEIRLKKLKLRLKDEMQNIVHQSISTGAA
jgi:uncharacterized protein YdcH (DUF465 family)